MIKPTVTDYSVIEQATELLSSEGFDVLGKVLEILINTAMLIERINKEIKRRTRVVCILPNTESCLRLVSALLMETFEEWLSGKQYICFDA